MSFLDLLEGHVVDGACAGLVSSPDLDTSTRVLKSSETTLESFEPLAYVSIHHPNIFDMHVVNVGNFALVLSERAHRLPE